MPFKIKDRVVLQSGLTTPDKKNIKSGTICTIVSFLSEEIAIVRYGYNQDTEQEKVVGVPVSLLRSASVDELETVEINDIVSKSFHIGQKYLTGNTIGFKDIEPNTKGTIVGVIIGENELEDIVRMDFNTGEIHDLTRDFVEKNFYVYLDDLEENLGEEVVISGAKKNYHLIGARVIAEDNEEIVIIMAKANDDDELFLVDKLNGDQLAYKKEYLKPILNPEILYTTERDKVIQAVCLPGKSFEATNEISSNILLRDEFKPGDVVKIIEIESININAFEDTFRVKRTGGEEMTVSYADLRYYFKPLKGLIKNSTKTNKVIVNGKDEYDSLAINEKGEVETNYQESKHEHTHSCSHHNHTKIVESATPPHIKKNDPLAPKIKIHDITINDVRFKIKDDSVYIELDSIAINEIDRLTAALSLLKQYI